MNSLVSDLPGQVVEVKDRGTVDSSWTDHRQSSTGDLLGVVRTVAVGQDGVIVLQIEDGDGWLHTRTTAASIFRIARLQSLTKAPAKDTSIKFRFRDLVQGQAFRFKNPPDGWARTKLVKLKKMPGWAMAEGWDFVLADDPDCQDFLVEPLDEQPPVTEPAPIPQE